MSSPLRGDIEGNIKKAEEFCRFVVDQGHLPYAPHVFFTRFLDDTVEKERKAGIAGGIEFLKVCDEMWVFGEVVSEGMKKEIEVASEMGIPITFVPLSRLKIKAVK